MPPKEKVPKHIAIIPDGNRRWAKKRGLPSVEGHRQGVRQFHVIMDEAFRQGVSCLTFWAASEDNLTKRSRLEVKLLVALLRRELASKEFREKLVRDKVQIRFIGRWNEILRDPGLAEAIRETEEQTRHFAESHLTILLGYDGRQEMVGAIRKIAASKKNADVADVSSALATGFLPPVDLVIRTGEEDPGWTHWSSGFMMWLTAQSEFAFTKTFWPAFSVTEFGQMLARYAERERRFGK